MAVSLDAVTCPRGATPPEAPLAMPTQVLDCHSPVAFAPAPWRTRLARVVTFGGAAAVTAFATYQMALVVSLAEVTALQGLWVVLFACSFAWIALAATGAVAGVMFGGVEPKAAADARPTTRTVLVMPVYNEDPASTFSLLRAMGEALAAKNLSSQFEIFVISDTSDPDIWVRETAAFQLLQEALDARLAVWYRRRYANPGKKAGNVHEFVTRWGARYDNMIVLDADSLLSPDAIATLVCEMEADPDCGILQTLPHLYGGRTLFARLQQFASAVYGPVVARGITAWQGEDGNYWGHNAIIRLDAFAAAAGLPTLAGRRPFGGEILSHDFVEAALVRRAGWRVRMVPDLAGSWEESPPSLLEVAVRDRRWAQGNLQHLAVIRAHGLRWPNRAHMVIGVMSYLASPLWLALIVVGLIITGQATIADHEYFGEGLQLFPNWPVFDSARMITLFVITMGFVLLPKMLGLMRALADRRLRQSIGIGPLLISVPLETFFSVLYAPIFMLIQTRQVVEILRGRDSGWSAQRRTHNATPWSMLIRRHAWHTLIGISVTAGLMLLSLPLLIWMSPTLLGLILAIPLSALSGSVMAAAACKKLRLLRIPEESSPPDVMNGRDALRAELAATVDGLTLADLLDDQRLAERHFATVSKPPQRPRGSPDLAHAGAALKIKDAANPAEALGWFSSAEKMALLCHEKLFVALRNTCRHTPLSEV